MFEIYFLYQDLISSPKTYYYLVGDCIESFGEQLPTGLQVVKFFCSEWHERKSNQEKIKRVVSEIISVWDKARIPVRSVKRIHMKVEKHISRLKNILNTRTRSSIIQVEKENAFLTDSRILFDVIDEESEASLCVESKKFLSDQRNARLQEISDFNFSDNSSEDDRTNQSPIGEVSMRLLANSFQEYTE